MWTDIQQCSAQVFPGVQTFQSKVQQKKRNLFTELLKGQKPEALFITCSDSRVNPGLITQSDPGTLFEIENAGNLVTPYEQDHPNPTAATIEYAMNALKVPHIIVCGHSHCGAVTGMLDVEQCRASLPIVAAVIEPSSRHVNADLTDEARRREQSGDEPLTDAARLEFAVQSNVSHQLDNLLTHPSVRHRFDAGEVQIHGWFYRFESGEIKVTTLKSLG